MDNRPDLPQLDSVEARTLGMLMLPGVILLVMVPTIAFMIQACLRHPDILHRLPTRLLINGVLASLFTLVLSAVFANYYWKTDADGLSVSGLFRRRFIKWSEFVDATSRTNWAGETIYSFKTGMGSLAIPARIPANGWQEDVLLASIWQHLRRYGKADKLSLTDGSQSLWDEIPDDLPGDLEWSDPRPVAWQIHAMLGAIFVCFLGWITYPALSNGNYVLGSVAVLFTLGVAAGLYVVDIRPALRAARRVCVCLDYIQADVGRSTLHIPWSEVTDARWNAEKSRIRMVIFGALHHTQVVIPFNPRDDRSLMLNLAIIRRLRTAGKPTILTIPMVCRNQSQAGFGSGKAELRLSTAERVGVSILTATASPLFVMIATHDKATTYPLVVGAVISVFVGWFISRAYVIQADDVGISKSFMGFRKSVRWDQVAELQEQKPLGRRFVPCRILKDANGEVLMEVSAGIGSQQDRDSYKAVLNAHLSRILPADHLDKPWKSRPWTADAS